MEKFKRIFQNANYVKLFFANFTSQMGSTIGLTAFMFYLLDRFSEQPFYATLTELMFSVPTLAVFFLVGVFADRMDRQKIAYYCDWISSLLSIVLLLTVIIGWMPLIFAVLFLRSAIQKFFFPAEHAMIQGILKNEDYTTAAGLNQVVMSLFMLFGNGLGIFVYWTMGVYGAIMTDALTFIISALLIRSCRIPEEVRLPNGGHKLKDLNIALVFKDFNLGMKYILKHRLLSALLVGFFVFGVVNGGFSIMPIFMLKYKLDPHAYEEYSVLLGITFGIGVLIGSVAASLLAQKFKLYQLIIAGLLLSGSFIIAASFAESTFIFLSLLFAAAFGLPLVNIAIGGWMPSIVDPKMMGRVQGWISPLMMLSQSLTLGFIAVSFPGLLKVEMLYWMVGGCLALVGVFYSLMLPGLTKKSEKRSEAHSSEQTGAV
ncbi:MFS transporter [Cytobacillus firmus]|uniref:MFS transporter n=2 Tax=Cytobacillus TaxID=2675230 RepID=A0A366JVF5_CYTFI|nr:MULTISPECIES: MFS transporter [Cytobacillus]RBP92365.1 MFS transporter [Cytobacillus firmus]TDX41950.1 MFS transporter [Cytobacillus oceanisediminis]